jgi:hypothetical protein
VHSGHDPGAGVADAPVPGERLPAIGVLIRRVPVRVRDVSMSGCLIESRDDLPEGSVGLLDLLIEGQVQSETIRVCRASRHTGSPWPWRAGAHFLALAAPSSTSVRNVVARFEIMDEIGAAAQRLGRAQRVSRAESSGSVSPTI